VEDVRDALRWVRDQGPKLFSADPAKIAVAGGSAGGYLTLMSGVGPDPLPRVLVSYWGFGDMTGDWVTKPSAFFRSHMARRPREKVYQAVGNGVLTNTEGSNNAKQQGRTQFFYHLRQNGLWTREATGLDPQTEAEKIYPFCPVRNITPRYPPTLLIHGSDDNDVPVKESEAMAAELARHKVPHELIVVQGAGHGLGGGDKKLVAEANDRALAFIREHLK
jgi:acetyl esterase/lipase